MYLHTYMCVYIFHDMYITDYFPSFVTVFYCHNNVALNILVNVLGVFSNFLGKIQNQITGP